MEAGQRNLCSQSQADLIVRALQSGHLGLDPGSLRFLSEPRSRRENGDSGWWAQFSDGLCDEPHTTPGPQEAIRIQPLEASLKSGIRTAAVTYAPKRHPRGAQAGGSLPGSKGSPSHGGLGNRRDNHPSLPVLEPSVTASLRSPRSESTVKLDHHPRPMAA